MGESIIIIFDFTSKVTYKLVPNWYHHLVCVFENIPIDSCGTKIGAIKKETENKVGFVSQNCVMAIIYKASVLLSYLI